MPTQTINPDHIFQLPYHGGFQTYQMPAYMLRHWDECYQEWSFSVHAADDGRCLGDGDTKQDAISSATGTLARVAEERATADGRIDRPYGKRIK